MHFKPIVWLKMPRHGPAAVAGHCPIRDGEIRHAAALPKAPL